MRAGGGTGFKAPTIFIEEVEERGLQNVQLSGGIEAEKSLSGSFDINWRSLISDEIAMTVNAAAYFTRLDNALVADDDSLAIGSLFLRNATGETISRGAEVSTKFNYDDFKPSLDYTFPYATQNDRDQTYELELNPRHSLGLVLMWESEEVGAKVGFEAYYTGTQRLEDHPRGDRSPDYWITGLLAEKAFGPLRLFINFKNFTDTRQTRFEPIIVGNPETVRVRAVGG